MDGSLKERKVVPVEQIIVLDEHEESRPMRTLGNSHLKMLRVHFVQSHSLLPFAWPSPKQYGMPCQLDALRSQQ